MMLAIIVLYSYLKNLSFNFSIGASMYLKDKLAMKTDKKV
jgi:hypothetical protein